MLKTPQNPLTCFVYVNPVLFYPVFWFAHGFPYSVVSYHHKSMAVGFLVSNILVLVTKSFFCIGGRPSSRNKYFRVIERVIYFYSKMSRYLNSTYSKIVFSEKHHLFVGIAYSPVGKILVAKGCKYCKTSVTCKKASMKRTTFGLPCSKTIMEKRRIFIRFMK